MATNSVITKCLLICVLCVAMSHGKPSLSSKTGDKYQLVINTNTSNNVASLSFPANSVPRDLINDAGSQSDNDGNHTVFILEGDIAVDYNASSGQDESSARYAINNNWNVWKNGRIPYVIDGSLCGSQTLSLGNGCLLHGVVVHELMHAIGFYHMHSRSERDNYLTVLWGNIQNNMKGEFHRNAPRQNRILGPFDYESIMLYGAKLFSWNGRDTMIARKRGVSLRDTAVKWGLSKYDAYNINELYGCSNKRAYTPTKPIKSPNRNKIPRKNTGNNWNYRRNRNGRRRG